MHDTSESKFDFVMRCRRDPSDPEHKLCISIRGEALPKYLKLDIFSLIQTAYFKSH